MLTALIRSDRRRMNNTSRSMAACLLSLLLLGACDRGGVDDGLSTTVLRPVRDVPMAGSAVRFDYQDVDAEARRLYIAHLGANEVDVVDVDTLERIATVGGVTQVHGVRLAPELHTLFATATGSDTVVAIDTRTLQVVGRSSTGRFPDGVGYDPVHHLVAVSDKDGGSETIVDAQVYRVVRTVPLGKEVGNVVYEPVGRVMLAAVRPPEQLVAFDAATGEVTARIRLTGCSGAHGVSVDAPTRRAFVACEDNARLAVVDLEHRRQTATTMVGRDPDVLAVDPGLSRLYVAAESGILSVFDISGDAVRKLGQGHVATRAHTVAVDPRTHRVFFPLENVAGRPLLRVLQP